MTDIATLKKEVVVAIKSILVNYAKEGIRIDQLNREYRENIAKNGVPFSQLGFASLSDFLKSIPNDVYFLRRGPETLIFPIPDEKNAHILTLVKKTPKAKGGRKSKYGGRSSSRPYSHSSQSYSSYNNSNRSRDIQAAINTSVINPSIDAFDRAKIDEFLSRFGENGVDIDDFQTVYKKNYSFPLNYLHFGFYSLVECLKSIPDVVTLKEYNGKMLCISTQSIKKAKAIREQQQQQQSLTTPSVPTKKTEFQIIQHASASNTNQTYEEQQKYPLEGATSSNYYTVESPEAEMDSVNLNKTLKRKMMTVLEHHKRGLSVDDFAQEYERIHQQPLDLEAIGYVDIMELIEQFPEIFGLIHPENPNENFIIYDSRQEASFVKELNKKKVIPENLVTNIKQILIINPEGISFPSLEEDYKLNFKVELPYLNLGYFTMESFVKELNSSVPDTFNIFEESGTKKISLIQEGEQQRSLPKRQYKVPSPEQPLTQQPSLPPNVPEDAATIEDRYKQQTLDDRYFDKYFEVIMSDVTNPGLFYIQVVGIEMTGTLDVLMNKLEETYNLPRGTEYMVPHNCFVRSMPCVALYCGDWHRAKMLGFPNKDDVEVFYVDYGTKSCVKREQIRFIKKSFMDFNSQAIKARLAGLKPVDSLDLWSLDSGYRLLDLTRERELLCKAITYDYEKGMSVELHVDDDNGYDLCVNDVLVDEGYAEPNDNELEELRSLYNSENSEYQVETYENPTAENVPFVEQPIINNYSTLEEETQSNRISKYPPGFDKSILEKLSEKVLREKEASDSLDCRTPSPEPETEEAEIPFVARVPFQHPSFTSQPTANVQPNIGGHATPNEPITQIVEPEASHKATSQQNLTNAINGDSQEASSCVTSRKYVKKVKLPMNCNGHFINYNSKLFLTSGDISHFIYGSNVFLKMFHKLIKFQDLEMLTIARNECPALFDELTQYKVRGFEDTSTQQNCCVVTLVPLESCIKALEKVHTNHEELKRALQDALDNFDPLDPCWMQTKNDISNEQNEIETPEFIQEQFLKLSAERKGIGKRIFEEDYSLETHLEYLSVTEKFQYYRELCQTMETAQSEKPILKSIEELSLKNETYSNISNERHRNVRSVQAVAPISAVQTPVSSTQVRNMISAATNNNFTGVPLSAADVVANPNIFYPNLLSQPNMIFPNMQYMQQFLYQQHGAPPFQSETLFNNNVPFPQGFFNPLNKHP